MNIQEDQIIGELVATDYRTASIFKKYGVDFCCQGNRTIHDACATKKIDEQIVMDDLNELLESSPDQTMNFVDWPLDLLADYIEKKHHRYVVEKVGEIAPYLQKLCKVHGERHPELFDIKAEFDAAAIELTEHMMKEEKIVFPFVRKMVLAKHEKGRLQTPHFGTIQHPIQVMMNEHSVEGERFAKIAALSNSYTPPSDACNTYRVTYALLNEFEQDLHAHIHLENNILFPGAIKMEKEWY